MDTALGLYHQTFHQVRVLLRHCVFFQLYFLYLKHRRFQYAPGIYALKPLRVLTKQFPEQLLELGAVHLCFLLCVPLLRGWSALNAVA